MYAGLLRFLSHTRCPRDDSLRTLMNRPEGKDDSGRVIKPRNEKREIGNHKEERVNEKEETEQKGGNVETIS